MDVVPRRALVPAGQQWPGVALVIHGLEDSAACRARAEDSGATFVGDGDPGEQVVRALRSVARAPLVARS